MHLPKVFLIVVVFNLTAIVQSGCFNPCNCPPPIPFFDYSAFSAFAGFETETLLAINLYLEEYDFLAFHRNPENLNPGFSFYNSAMACSCIPDGNDGPKYPIESIDIFSDKVFKDGISESTNLNSYFEVRGLDYEPVFPADGDIMVDFSVYNSPSLRLTTEENPDDLTQNYTFEIRITKSNGETLVSFSNPVKWN